MIPCPLKEAALDTPNTIAVLDRGQEVTYRELDRLVDNTPLVKGAKERNSLSLILKFFSAMRKESSFFPIHPNLPQALPEEHQSNPSLLLYTSGSTSKPKIAVLSYQSLIQNARDAVNALDLKPEDQWKLSLPLYHVGGIGILLRCILARSAIVIDDSWRVTHLSCVPTQLYRASPVYRKLRCVLLGGAPLQNIPNYLPIRTTYGLTEMGSMVTLDGTILPNREVKLSSDQEIWVRGPTLFEGYWNEKPQKGWFATGDLGRLEKGKLVIAGRKDWMFISGGENIQPEEIESHLLEDSRIHQAVIVPVDDPEYGKRPIAVVQANFDYTFEKMQTFLKNRLAPFKIPVGLIFIKEMPLLSNLKLNRFILSQMIQKQLDENKKIFQSGQKKRAYL